LSSSGGEIAGWYGGPLIPTSAGAAVASPSAGRASLSCGPGGEKVVADLGRVGHGFGRPVVLSRNGTGGEGLLRVAISGAGVGYAAWLTPNCEWKIVTFHAGRHSRPRRLLPSGAQLQGLFSGGRGPVVALWDEFPAHGRPSIRYARLDRAGRLERVHTVADVHHDDSYPEAAVNDRGQLAVAWTRGGATPGQNQAALVVVCTPSRRCSRPRARTLGGTRPAYENIAVSISDDGTVALVAAGHPNDGQGEAKQLGVWAAVGARGAPLGPMRRLAPAGDFPLAVADGRGGALTAFSHSGRALAWARLAPGHRRFRRPALVSRSSIYEPALAANLEGRFIVVWNRPSRNHNPSYALLATEGRGGHLEASRLVAPASDNVDPAGFSAGIDGRGEAIVLWQDFSSQGTGGLFAARRS
jgi:hypothetical protein